ncbi:MAG: CHASE2 domain-containing protein [Lachnospiraceae bacterium]|nr:CHASE2 domain-containing protein [Lachnospiraceae bacterium]
MKKNPLWKSLIYALPVTIVVVLMLLFKSFLEVESSFEDKMYQKEAAIPWNVKIIGVDEESLAQLGPYSNWNRSYFAKLVDILMEDKENAPLIIGFDFVFSGTDDSEADRELARAVKEAGNVVLASQLEFATKIVMEGDTYEAVNYVSSEAKAYDALQEGASHGFTNVVLDEDGYVRKVYSQLYSEEQSYANFAYEIAKKFYEMNPEAFPKANFDRDVVFDLVYTGVPGDFEKIPMSSVLSGKVKGSYFADSIVLIGAYEEGMRDAYSVPIDHKRNMYGVEIHANTIWALLSGKEAGSVPLWMQIILTVALSIGFAMLVYSKRLSRGVIFLPVFVLGYILLCMGLYATFHYKLSVLYTPLSFVLEFLVLVLVKYIEMQKRKAEELQETLFSMADAMAEAIDGRTPYNASHTKNVAIRSVEMVDYINELYKAGKTELHFSKADRKQLYLAAMLHDVGKMDVPIEVMDKPTKLGDREKQIKDRLAYIKVLMERDVLAGKADALVVLEKTEKIDAFLGKLGLYNCGKPLKPEDFAEADVLLEETYTLEDGTVLPYITKEESDSIHIKAGTLSDEERATIQSHVTFTDKILSHVKFCSEFDRVRAMASNHHEVLNGKGYPKGLKAEELDTLTRILTIMDIYDALVADDRPYKKAKPIPVAFDILDEEAQFGKVDAELLAIAKQLYLEPFLAKQKAENA